MTYQDRITRTQDMYQQAVLNILQKKKGYCTHGRKEMKCKECGGTALCEHGGRKDRCVHIFLQS